MQVAINARAAARAQIGGVERLAREMSRRLPRLSPERYRVLEPAALLAHKLGHAWEQAVLPVQSAGSALIYSPANLAPVVSRRNVLVIHDAAVFRHPDAFAPGYLAYHRMLLRALVRRARLLIAPSRFAGSELVEVLGADPDRLRIVPEGVGEEFAAGAEGEERRLRGAPSEYVLVVGTVSARKNLSILSAASRALAERGIELLVAGAGRSYLPAIDVSFRRLGYVADEDLPSLYRHARAVAMPSLYEGFGLPCLEAMASGAPVVAAAAGALPETVGDAGLLVEPDDATGFAEALVAAVDDERLRRRLIQAGHRRAGELTWERTARLTDDVIVELLSEEGR